MIKVHNIHIGAKSDLYQLNDDWAFVHACKTSHKERLGYTKPPKNEPYYFEFLNLHCMCQNHNGIFFFYMELETSLELFLLLCSWQYFRMD